MGLVQAFTGALTGTLADQWKDVITAGNFGEYTVVAPGMYRPTNNGRGSNYRGSADVISNGSKIFVPEGTAAFIFSQGAIEDVVTVPGGYEYWSGQASIFAGDGFQRSIVDQVGERFGFGGQTSDQKYVAFINLREIRGLKFGTRGPVAYHDRFYGADLEILAFGTFSLRVVDPVAFVRNFLPPGARYYAFDSSEARQQISAEFLQAFIAAVNSLSATHRISELPSQTTDIATLIADDESTLGSWIARYGLDVVQVGIESIEFSADSRALVKQYASSKLSVTAYDGVSQHSSNVAAQQKIASGVENHGFGDGAGTLLGLNLAQSISPANGAPIQQAPGSSGGERLTLDEQIELVKKLKELLDAGILSADEFQAKKREVMGI